MSENDDASKLQDFGLKFTKIYLIILFGLIPVAAYSKIIVLRPLGLNEIGDFLAGAFGPLAIFWLVLGFFQQGRELQNSVAALNLQAKELNNSVQQQAEMVKVTKETLDHEKAVLRDQESKRKRALQPVFKPKFNSSMWLGDSLGKFGISILNQGHIAYDLKAELYDNEGFSRSLGANFLENTKTLSLDNVFGEFVPFPNREFKLRISYVDAENSVAVLKFLFRPEVRESPQRSDFTMVPLLDEE